MSADKKFPIPTSYFSMVLGLSALGLVWRYTEKLRVPPFLENLPLSSISEALLGFSALLWLLLLAAYILKCCCYPQLVKAEFKHNIQGSFISLIPITTILVSFAFEPYFPSFAHGLIAIGIFGQLSFACYYIAGMWQGTQTPESATPALYLPPIAANFVSATALGLIGYNDWGWLFWGAGIFSWISWESAMLRRLRTMEPIAAEIRPVMSILLAPSFVGNVAYLTLNGGQFDIVAKAMLGYGLLNFLFFIRLLPWIMEKGFIMPMWGFSFALASMAKVGLFLYQNFNDTSFGLFGIVLFVIANICIGLFVIGTLFLIIKGRFFVK